MHALLSRGRPKQTDMTLKMMPVGVVPTISPFDPPTILPLKPFP